MEKKKRRNFTFSLDPKLLAAIQNLAKSDNRTLSNYINVILIKHVEQAGQRVATST